MTERITEEYLKDKMIWIAFDYPKDMDNFITSLVDNSEKYPQAHKFPITLFFRDCRNKEVCDIAYASKRSFYNQALILYGEENVALTDIKR